MPIMAFLFFSNCKQTHVNKTCADCEYFECKIDGKEFYPSGPWKSNPLNGYIRTGRKGLVITAINGANAVSIDLSESVKVDTGNYELNEYKPGRGIYSFRRDLSSNGHDNYLTTDKYKGYFRITSLDSVNILIFQGTFAFTAYDSLTRKTVSITDGKFRLISK